MKRYIYILILLVLLASPIFGASTDITGKPTSYWLHGNPDRDNAWNWMKMVDNNVFGPMGTGKIRYVDSNVNIEGSGLTVDTAFDTMIEGINSMTADRGDVLYVIQGHVEDGVVGTANMWQASVSGITIWGLGEGSLKPRFDFNFTSNTCLVTAANVRLHNLRFRPSISAVAEGVLVTGDNVRITKCDFGYPEAAADEFAIALQVGTSTGGVVEDNFFDSGAQAGVTAITFEAADNLIIRNNRIYGDSSTAHINNALEISDRFLIEDNVLWQGDTAALNNQPVIEIMNSSMGISRRNYAACNLAFNTAFVGDHVYNFGNYYTEQIGATVTAFAIDLVGATTTTQSVTVSNDD